MPIRKMSISFWKQVDQIYLMQVKAVHRIAKSKLNIRYEDAISVSPFLDLLWFLLSLYAMHQI